jgi:hypothetical protein
MRRVALGRRRWRPWGRGARRRRRKGRGGKRGGSVKGVHPHQRVLSLRL